MQTKPPDAGKKHRAVFDGKNACESHGSMSPQLSGGVDRLRPQKAWF